LGNVVVCSILKRVWEEYWEKKYMGKKKKLEKEKREAEKPPTRQEKKKKNIRIYRDRRRTLRRHRRLDNHRK